MKLPALLPQKCSSLWSRKHYLWLDGHVTAALKPRSTLKHRAYFVYGQLLRGSATTGTCWYQENSTIAVKENGRKISGCTYVIRRIRCFVWHTRLGFWQSRLEDQMYRGGECISRAKNSLDCLLLASSQHHRVFLTHRSPRLHRSQLLFLPTASRVQLLPDAYFFRSVNRNVAREHAHDSAAPTIHESVSYVAKPQLSFPGKIQR